MGPLAGGLIVGYLHWSLIFFVNVPIGVVGLYLVLRYLPDYRADEVDPLDVAGMVLFGAGVALLSYVLEVFGEHTLSVLEMAGLMASAVALLVAYWHHASQASHPVLRLGLFRTRTFRVAVMGSFVTRLGAGGMLLLLPLLYQVGLGYTPVQSGLLIMKEATAPHLAQPTLITLDSDNSSASGLVIACRRRRAGAVRLTRRGVTGVSI